MCILKSILLFLTIHGGPHFNFLGFSFLLIFLVQEPTQDPTLHLVVLSPGLAVVVMVEIYSWWMEKERGRSQVGDEKGWVCIPQMLFVPFMIFTIASCYTYCYLYLILSENIDSFLTPRTFCKKTFHHYHILSHMTCPLVFLESCVKITTFWSLKKLTKWSNPF